VRLHEPDGYGCRLLDAGVSLRDVQITARHADPRTTMRYDRARKNLDRHPKCAVSWCPADCWSGGV
jgi:hypothetical protein